MQHLLDKHGKQFQLRIGHTPEASKQPENVI
jgi:hypothetical protein